MLKYKVVNIYGFSRTIIAYTHTQCITLERMYSHVDDMLIKRCKRFKSNK